MGFVVPRPLGYAGRGPKQTTSPSKPRALLCSLGEAGQPVGAGHSGTCRQARGKLLALRAGRRRGEDYISRQAARAGRRRGEKPVAPRWRSIRTCCSWTSTGCWGSARRRRRRRSAPWGGSGRGRPLPSAVLGAPGPALPLPGWPWAAGRGARGWVRARGCSPPPLTAAPSARLVPGFFLKRAPSSWFLLPRLCTLTSKVPPVFARNPVARGRSRRCRLLEVISLVLRVWNYMVMLFC